MSRQSCLRCHEICESQFCELFNVRSGGGDVPYCKMQHEVRGMRGIGWSPAIISAVLGLSLDAVMRWIN